MSRIRQLIGDSDRAPFAERLSFAACLLVLVALVGSLWVDRPTTEPVATEPATTKVVGCPLDVELLGDLVDPDPTVTICRRTP